jgi:hypothetical protein
MQKEAHLLVVRVLIKVVDPVRVELARTPFNTVDFIPLL